MGGKERTRGLKETLRRRITVTSSFISTDQLGIRVTSGQIFKDDVNGFFFISDICFMGRGDRGPMSFNDHFKKTMSLKYYHYGIIPF